MIICFLISIYEWSNIVKEKSFLIIGNIFILFSFYTVFEIRNNFGNNSLFTFIMLLVVSISTDIGGYCFGKIIKGPKLTQISPNKTYSGAIGGYILSILLTVLFVHLFNHYNETVISIDLKLFIILTILSIISQLGDLIISFFKRLYNIKNTGKLIPGHGGILDRIDGMIFVFPIFYILNNFINYI